MIVNSAGERIHLESSVLPDPKDVDRARVLAMWKMRCQGYSVRDVARFFREPKSNVHRWIGQLPREVREYYRTQSVV